jgi:fatty acid desaturase
MDIFIQQILNGLVLGSVYAIIALGYTMVYGILGIINFAHGDVLMVGAMVALSAIGVLQNHFPGLGNVATLIIALVIAACVHYRSILPAMYIGLPSLYGAWLQLYFGCTQHLGLAEDVLDHRLNSRTIYMNPIFRFLYWNMNYHVEHHLFPLIPYHALPRLHEAVRADCPPPYPSTIAAYREIIPALLRQAKDPTYFVRRELPPSARPAPLHAAAAKA